MTHSRVTSDQITELDLQALAALSGFGKAQEVLKAAGAWDEHAAAGREREFTVHLDGTVPVSCVVVVTARCRAEAEDKAFCQAERNEVDWYIRADRDDLQPMTLDSADRDL